MSPNGAEVGWGRYPNWLGYIRPFADKPEYLWPVLWSECPTGARPLPFPTIFPDRFWEAMEHWLPDGAGTDPENMRVLKGQTPHPHLGTPVGTEQEFLEGLSYETWAADGYADRFDEHCKIDVSLPFKVKLGVHLRSVEIYGPYVRDQVRLGVRLPCSEVYVTSLHDSIRLGVRLPVTENSNRMVADQVRLALRGNAIETSVAHLVDSVRLATRVTALETEGLQEVANVRLAVRGNVSEVSHSYLSDQVRLAVRGNVSAFSNRHIADQVRLAVRGNPVNSNHRYVTDQVRLAVRGNSTETFTPGDPVIATKYTIPYTSLQVAATSKTVTVATIAAKNVLHFVAAQVTTNFTLPGEMTLTLQLKWGGASMGNSMNALTGNDGMDFSANQGDAKSALPSVTHLGLGSFSGNTLLELTMQAFFNNLSGLTGGSIDVWVYTSTLP